MGVRLTDPRERAIEDALDALRVWANDAIDDLYERDSQVRVGPARFAARLPALVQRYAAAVNARQHEAPAPATKDQP